MIKPQSAGRGDNYVLSRGPTPYLGESFWEMAQSLFTSQEYSAATKLFRQNSPAQDIYLIDRGLIKLIYLSEAGQELIVGLRPPGGIIGAASAILQKPYPLTAVTLTECLLRRIPVDAFIALLKTDAAFSWQIHQMQSADVYAYFANVTELACHSARHRLEQLLSQLVIALELKLSQREIHLKLPLKHWELAELVSVSPAYLSRLFKQLEEDGILRRESGELVISGFDRLRHSSEF